MITQIQPEESTAAWQKAMANAITDPAELFSLLQLDPSQLPAALDATALFKLRVPRGYAASMKKGDPTDPLLLQVLPLGAELAPQPDGYELDPVGDIEATSVPGVIHKYHGRVLLITTGACAVHCRYCFRRHFPYAESSAGRASWEPALNYLRQHPEVDEVILSGGDPLSLSDTRLARLSAELDRIPHLKRLRIHTRQPVVLPERVDRQLLAWLQKSRLQPVMVIHANHPAELSPAVVNGLATLHQAGVVLFNQAVLLRQINNQVTTLETLCKLLFENNVSPYYLHLLDKVQGAAHFAVGIAEARQLIAALQARLPGYLVPRLVQEIAGAASKTPVHQKPE